MFFTLPIIFKTLKSFNKTTYAGNLTVAERPIRTMRSRKRQYIPYAEREVIYGTHEPIIEQNRWNNVQKILQSRPPVIGESTSGYDNIFRGIIKCADCGSAMLAKVEQKRKRNNVIDKTFYCCTKYRKFGKEGCSSHTIEARTVHEVVLADIQKHAGQALADRKAMVTEIAERLNLQLSADREQQKKELRQQVHPLLPYPKLCHNLWHRNHVQTHSSFLLLPANILTLL